MKKIILIPVVVIFFIGIILIGKALLAPEHQNYKFQLLQTQNNRNSNFITQDFIKLHKAKMLPKYFYSLKTIELQNYDSELANEIKKENFPFLTSQTGLYKLEAEAFSAHEKKSKILVIQINILDLKTGNKIYEISRNYELNNK